jgi:hypothetical protein
LKATSENAGYIFEFLSGKYEGGEFDLGEQSEISVGRSNERDMVLVEDMVSRHHANFEITDEGVFVEDLGSTNGTFVNGEKISSKTRLEVGDRVLIGTNIMKLVSRESDSSRPQLTPESEDESQGGHETKAEAPSASSGSGTRQTAGAGTLSGSISGFVDEVPLEDLFHLFQSSNKSGVLVIQTEKDTGRIYLRDGDVYYAELDSSDSLDPEKAFYRILAWGRGQFSLEKSGGRSFDDELEKPTDELLEEGMRQRDRLESLGEDVPDYSDPIRIAEPLVPPLRSLSEDQLDTFQLIINYDTVAEVLNQSRESDFEAMEEIVELVRQDYVEIE